MNMDILIVLPVALFVMVLGACVGSFLNVVIYRLPVGLSLLFPPSRCPQCLNSLKAYDNVPVLGWLWLRGRCRYCGCRISPRYPLVEAVTSILFLLVFFRFGLSGETLAYWQTLGYCLFLSWLLALSLIDLDTMTLPNSLTESGLVAGLGFKIIFGYFTVFSLAGSLNYLISGVAGVVLGIWLFDVIIVVGSMVLFRSRSPICFRPAHPA